MIKNNIRPHLTFCGKIPRTSEASPQTSETRDQKPDRKLDLTTTYSLFQDSRPVAGHIHDETQYHTLIGTADCTEDPRLFEVDATGKVVWEFSNADLPGKDLRHVCGIHRLPNGNTVLCNYLGHGQFGKAPQLIEITPDKKVVWTYGNHKDVRTVICVQLLEDAGEKALR